MLQNDKKKRALAVFAAVITLFLILTVLPIRGEEGIYDSVIRLHVIAGSNTDTDQSMKLFVRDRLLSECADKLVSESKSADVAVRELEKEMSEVEDCAQRAVYDYCKENSLPYVPEVTCSVSREHYPYKEYEGLCFPEGEYYSLRVVIGEGKGENWWCVLFPPLCFAAASERNEETNESDFVSVGITPDQYKVISGTDTPRYRIRFRLLEFIEELFSR